MRVFLSSLGCKLNQAELEAAARRLRADGHEIVGRPEAADVQIVNTCTVTSAAARDSRKTARRGMRRSAELRTVLTGCWASEEPDAARTLPGVGLVVENAAKQDLVERVYAAFPELCSEPSEAPARVPAVPVSYVPLAFGNTRAALKIEDGCNMRCAFCIIPSTRGRQTSRPPEQAIADLQDLAAEGVQEVVVTGVQISSYRHQKSRLHDLVQRMLRETDIPRLRLTSIAPWQFDHRLMDLWRSDRVCRHVHLSLQSGCDATLKRMRRPYTAEQYGDLVAELRSRISRLAVTTDVIVGFPGETEREFEESLEFVASCGFARTHVFTYSERAGTLAASMPGSVPHPLRKERTARMIEAGTAAQEAFELAQVGTTGQVLWEDMREGLLRGTTDNYLRVQARVGLRQGEEGSPQAALLTRAAGPLVPLGAREPQRWSEAQGTPRGPQTQRSRRRPGQLETVLLRRDAVLGLVA